MAGQSKSSAICEVLTRVAPVVGAVSLTYGLLRFERFELPIPTTWKLPPDTLDLLGGTAALAGSLVAMWLWQGKNRTSHSPVLIAMALLVAILLAYNANVIVRAPPAKWTWLYDRFVELLYLSAYGSFGFFCTYVGRFFVEPLRDMLALQPTDRSSGDA
jgi:hypothetical protein